ncbi:hypothetical protein J7I79_23950 [Arthrobacter sp. ISL-69]|nr:hypothetical protein [Arthrobacter sp. ISL-69]
MSRGTIRQALGELQRRRLISIRSGIGSFVTFDGHALDRRLGWLKPCGVWQQRQHTRPEERTVPRYRCPELIFRLPAFVDGPGTPDHVLERLGLSTRRVFRVPGGPEAYRRLLTIGRMGKCHSNEADTYYRAQPKKEQLWSTRPL